MCVLNAQSALAEGRLHQVCAGDADKRDSVKFAVQKSDIGLRARADRTDPLPNPRRWRTVHVPAPVR